MVLRVCQHVLADPNDAEDSFQATFLILVRKARSMWVQESLGPWLHRVAHRVATRARFSAARVREHEKRAAAMRPTFGRERGDRDELLSLVHEEIDRLPEPCRVPVVLCDLQGLTHEKAARHLGWPVGTVKSRLARGRELLRGRLSRRGLGLPAGVKISETALGGACRTVALMPPDTLVESTLRAVAAIAAGKAPAIGMISSRVAILIEEVLRTMVVTRLKLASVFVLMIGAAGTAGVLAQQSRSSGASQTGHQIRQGIGVGSAHAPAPAYFTQSRAMILTRLEEEVEEARARLERTIRKFPSPDNPAAIRARDTLEALVQRLDRIDRVLVDVVETYPTMVDFSRGPSDAKVASQVGVNAFLRESGDAAHRLNDESRNEVDPTRPTDRDELANPKREQRESSPTQPVDETPRRRQSQKTDKPDDSGKQGRNGEPKDGYKPDDSGKQGRNGEPKGVFKPDDSSKQSQSGEPKGVFRSDDSSKQSQSGEPKGVFKPDDSSKQSQSGKPKGAYKQDDSGKQSPSGEPKGGYNPDDSGKQGQKSQPQLRGDQSNTAKQGQKSQQQSPRG
jgi:RNA polymerase sigma factor (sigma-70 family)